MIGPDLYTLTSRDRQQAQIESVADDSNLQALASVSWRIFRFVPNNKILVLQNLAGFGQGTGGQLCNGIFFLIAPPNAPTTVFTRLAGRLETPTTTIERDVQFGAGLIVQPGSSIQLAGDFNAGVAANNLRLWVTGYYVPRGNVGIGSLL
jgi:hypothetical protein